MASFLPYEMVWEIYQFLKLRQVLGCSRVSKVWARAARHHRPCEDVNRNLQYCVWMNDVPLAKEYIKYGADVNAIVSDFHDVDTLIGLALLMHSCSTSSILGLLLAGGANITEKHLLFTAKFLRCGCAPLLFKQFMTRKTPISASTAAFILTSTCVSKQVELLDLVYTMDIPADATDIVSGYMSSSYGVTVGVRRLLGMVPYSLEKCLMILAIKYEAIRIIRYLLDKFQMPKEAICRYIDYARAIQSFFGLGVLMNWVEDIKEK